MNNPVIELKSVSKTYIEGITRRKIQAVTNVDLTVDSGEVFAFIGLNGAGKTTTIKLLLDHARPTSGSVSIFGINAREPRARERIGYLPDLPHFYRFLNAWEVMDYCGRLFGMNKAQRRGKSRQLLELVGLAGRADEALKGYSRGMLQRLGLAQALINDPDLVILDEPLGGLDPLGRIDLRNIINGLKEQGKTVFFSSHILDDAQRIADRIGIIHQGRLVVVGSLNELLEQAVGWELEILPLDGFDIVGYCTKRSLKCEVSGDLVQITISDETLLPEFHQLASAGSIMIMNMSKSRVDLENVFTAELEKWDH